MITELLGVGRENRKTTEELLSALQIDRRSFFSALKEERRNGNFILSDKTDGGGYWLWSGDYDELKRYDKMQRSGALDILVTLKPVYRKLKEKEGADNGKTKNE